MFEYKKLIQPVQVNAIDLSQGQIEVVNDHDFINMAHLAGTFELIVNGRIHQTAPLPTLDLLPGKRKTITLPLDNIELGELDECFLNVRFHLIKSNRMGRHWP